jgi:signal transduction histidine kinase
MAKHVSTIGPRSSAPAKSCAFAALNGIENALTDATGTVEVLDDYTDYQGSADDYRSAVETVVRHLRSDMAALRAAFDAAHGTLVKGGAA